MRSPPWGVTGLAEAEAALERGRVRPSNDLRRCEAEIKAVLQANGTRSIEALAQLLADRHAELEAIHDRLDSLGGYDRPGGA